jgi:BarA-like signal transduction histidine kinase
LFQNTSQAIQRGQRARKLLQVVIKDCLAKPLTVMMLVRKQ